jgi:hypothetical protein
MIHHKWLAGRTATGWMLGAAEWISLFVATPGFADNIGPVTPLFWVGAELGDRTCSLQAQIVITADAPGG